MIWYNDMIYNMQYYLPILCEGQAWGQAVGPSQKACLFQCLSPWLFSTRPCKHRFVNYSTVFSPCGPFLLKPLVSKTTGITVQLNKAIGQNPYILHDNLRVFVAVERLPFSFAAPKTSRHCKVQLARSWRRCRPLDGGWWEISQILHVWASYTRYTVPKCVLTLPLLHFMEVPSVGRL